MQRLRLAAVAVCMATALGLGPMASADEAASSTSSLQSAATVEQVMASYGASALQRLQPKLAQAGFPYAPPNRLMLLAFKQERRMEIWGMGVGRWRLIASYRILAASGRPGPKLKEGDRQVPEGIYPIAALNAASHYHLALRIGYPNENDLQQAAIDGRMDLGGDIMIHGSEVSSGCLAMGDSAIEEIFALVQKVGVENTQVLIAPHDLRSFPAVADSRDWVLTRYAEMTQVLQQFKRP